MLASRLYSTSPLFKTRCRPTAWTVVVNLCTETSRLTYLAFISKAGDTLSSRHVSSCDVNAFIGDVRGDLTLNSVAQIHTSVTLRTSRGLAWSSGRLTCQHASQISSVAHISWDVTYVSSALQTLPVVSRNGGNSYWKSAQMELFIRHQVTRL
jgi:hypothetical protein